MTYATRADLEDRYGTDELQQRESMLPAGAVAGALADADAEIDSYLATRYTLPLASVPSLLKRLACSIARYSLLGDAASDRARTDYEDARRMLVGLSNGSVTLGLATPVVGDPAGGGIAYDAEDAVFDGAAGF